MPHVDSFPEFLNSFPELELPFAGARGRLIQGDGQQVVFVEFADDLDVPEHTHDEQWEFVLTGRVTLKREGEQTDFVAGDNFFIPAGVPHAARVHAGYKAMIVFNSPDRYQAKR